ncbi:MAG: hypothetical protein Q8K58_09155 [Acidimicrobiales bacterium]|nr:hypothetical protein [Acidimicrobiales bacterium]
MVRRRSALVPAGVALLAAAFGCRTSTVSVAFTPDIGDRYVYRYEITATITREVQGSDPEVIALDTELTADQQVRAITESGARIRATLTRESGAPRTAIVVVDRAGSLSGVELIEGLSASAFGLADAALVPTHLEGPPDGPLELGDEWSIGGATREGTGRLERLGVVDDVDVAVVRSSLTQQLQESVDARDSDTDLSGTLRSGALTSYDLTDGAIRRSRSWSSGTLDAHLAPPIGVQAEPVEATLTYDISVRVTRLG